jgi:two-component system cell cycle response regulator DivK
MGMAKVLLAEDHDDNREMLLRRISRAGFEVRGACHGEEAVTQALDWKPELILMDISMPIMSGLDATRLIRQKLGASVRIIALTAHAMDESREACLEAGCDAFATKPVEWPHLLDEMNRQLAKSASQ